jgi:hypothetical protein
MYNFNSRPASKLGQLHMLSHNVSKYLLPFSKKAGATIEQIS